MWSFPASRIKELYKHQTLIKLCTDICQRNGKRKLLWLADKDKTLAYEPAADEMVLTVHRWFANKSCPGAWMYERMGDLAAKVTAALGSGTVQETAAGQSAKSAACDASKVVAVAVAEIGYKEKKSNSQLDDKSANVGSSNYTKYARDFDQKYPKWYNGKKNGFAWCDMFVDWCFLTAYGYENALRLLCQPEKSCGAGCTYSLRYYKSKGQFHTSGPKPGDQIFFGTSQDNSTHTGIVEKVTAQKVYTIEGNTSDQVARRNYALTNSRILGYGRPAYDAVQETAPAEPPDASVPETEPSAGVPFLVRVAIPDLNIRRGPGTDYARTGSYTGIGVFTIVDVSGNWGKLKSGAGWISLNYCTILK